MADERFGHPRLAPVYDPLDPDRGALDPCLRLAGELGARRVLDIGCGTGVFALLLADPGVEAGRVDPASASLDAARTKPGAGRVRRVRLIDVDGPLVTFRWTYVLAADGEVLTQGVSARSRRGHDANVRTRPGTRRCGSGSGRRSRPGCWRGGSS